MNSVVVIPVYKDFCLLSEPEKKNLIQCFKVLKAYPITFAGPQNLNYIPYHGFSAEYDLTTKNIVFDELYFKDLPGYNKLLLSEIFYQAFSDYEYMLIHQTDAFVFRDELNYWCNRGFDFIGSPWFENWGEANKTSKIIGVGNGGFSLRNINASLRLLRRTETVRRMGTAWYKSHLQTFIRFKNLIRPFRKLFKIKNIEDLDQVVNGPYTNEDHYWTQVLAGFFYGYNVAPVEDAIKFSFEVNPSLLFKLNNDQLPFACHAPEKHEPEFWSKYMGTPGLPA